MAVDLVAAAAPAGGPVAQPDHARGKVPHQNPAEPADDRRHDDVEQIAQRPLEHVGVGAAQGVEAVGALGADGGPHQGPAKQRAQQQHGHEESGHEHQRPQESAQQQPGVGCMSQPSTRTGIVASSTPPIGNSGAAK